MARTAPLPPRGKRASVRRAVHGVLLLDKPLGLSSHTALKLAQRVFQAEKAGHAGTLDPLATGLLPICFGAATKFSQFSLDADKRYTATLQLGATTTTGDREGEVLLERPVDVDAERLAVVCAAFTGRIAQQPPMYSALKHAGKPLYEYARAGIDVERAAREVTIHTLAVAPDGERGVGNRWTLDVRCSKGTYIRTLAVEIGEALGCGAHLAALRRSESGPLGLAAAHTLEALEALSERERDALLLAPDAMLADRPVVRLDADDAGRFLSGMRRRLPLADAACVRVYGPQGRAFLGAGHLAGGELISTRLLSPPEVQGLLNSPELENIQ